MRAFRGFRKRSDADFVYSSRYAVEIPGVAADPLRGQRILSYLLHEKLLRPDRIHEPEPATYAELQRVHATAYLDAATRPGALTRVIGLDLPDPLPDAFLAAQRAMAGGTHLALQLVRRSRGVAVQLGGGLHHAFADRGERFCVFNDVAVAIAALRQEGAREKILIVDLDLHDGDGTRALFAADPTVHTFSIHNRTAASTEAVESTAIELGGEVGDETYLETLQQSLPPVLQRFQPELVIYLAGTDPAADDEIGDWRISAGALLRRDRLVVQWVRQERRLPLAVALAGGYGQQAWRYSARFFGWLASGRELEPPSAGELTLAEYRRRFRRQPLSGAPDVHPLADWQLDDDDLDVLGGVRPRHRLLGYYSPEGLEMTLERAGLTERLRQRGFPRPTLELALDPVSGETMRIWGDRERRELLVELRLAIDRQTLPELRLLRLEWLLLQDPRGRFTAERPRLPGQKHPGLGILGDIVALMVLTCEQLRLDGLIFVPGHFHTAVQGKKDLRFLDPEQEGTFRALEEALRGLPLAEATLAVDGKRVHDAATGLPFEWRPQAMVLAIGERLKQRLGEDYERQAAAASHRDRGRFTVR